jgi:hypothetical protein
VEEAVIFNKDALIDELKQIHKNMVSVYRELFAYKYDNNEDFRNFIEKEYRENGIGKDDKDKWNENFCHRTSYTLINKVLFIRICEDKRFMFNPEEDFIMGEPKDPNIGKKLSARGRDKWISLISNYTFGELLKFAFADMKESFKNIALFKEDKYEKLNPTKQELELKFILDSKEYKKTPIYSYEENVAKIIEKLDTSKFDFNVPAEGNILGDVYEKFMDRETRKAIGQFYTPDFVIEYILNNTVAEADVVENPFVSVLDPACGSGHFLIMAYDILKKKFEENIDRLREKYADVDYIYKNENMKGKEYWVKDRIHYHILKHCIFGADIDSFAVQLTTINLLLKDLENFTDELNIMECDSLIKWEEDYDWQDLKQQLENHSLYFTINYKDMAGIHRQDTLSRDKAEELVRLCEFWAKKYDYVVGNPPYFNISKEKSRQYDFLRDGVLNISSIFVYIGLKRLKDLGSLGYIIPKVTTWVKSYKPIREEIIKYHIKSLCDVGIAFDDVGGEQTIFLIKKSNEKTDTMIYTRLNYRMDNFENFHLVKEEYLQKDILHMYLNDKNINIFNSIKNNKEILPLERICSIFRGAPIQSKIEVISLSCDDKHQYRILGGRNIERYYIRDSVYIDINHKQLNSYRNQILRQMSDRIGIQRLVSSKVRIIGAILDNKDITYDTITNLVFDKGIKVDLFYMIGLINSNLLTYYLKYFIFNNSSLNMDMDGHYVGRLPIILDDKENKISQCTKTIMNNIKKLKKEKICLINTKIDDIFHQIKNRARLEREIEKCVNEINRRIYYMYGLGYEEIYEIEKDLRNNNYGIKEETYRYEIRKNRGVVNEEEIVNMALRDIMNELTPSEFITEHIINNKSLQEIAEKYGYEFVTVSLLRENYARLYGGNEPWKFYNLSELYTVVNEYLKDEAIEILKSKKKYISLDDIRNTLKEKLHNFEELINIMRKDNPTKKSKDIVKEALNEFADTWNSYIKNKNADKEPKDLVKYYDSNYYGLSEWDDEIHKEYFIDAIKEYTEVNPNEKKARDILKLFEGLNIKDKEDYIEIFNSQIKKAFRR